MLNTGQNEVKNFGGSRFKKNQTRACTNQRDNAKLKSSDNRNALFTIFSNKQRTLHGHEISFCILCLDLLTIIFYLLRRAGTSRSSQQRCSVKKGVLRNFAKFTVKRLCQSLFFNKVAGAVLMLRRLVFLCKINFKVKLVLLYEKQFLSALSLETIVFSVP